MNPRLSCLNVICLLVFSGSDSRDKDSVGGGYTMHTSGSMFGVAIMLQNKSRDSIKHLLSCCVRKVCTNPILSQICRYAFGNTQMPGEIFTFTGDFACQKQFSFFVFFPPEIHITLQ